MPPPPPPPSDDELLEQCILALESAPDDVDTLLAAHPEQAARVRAQLQNLEQLGILRAPTAAPMPERLGDFRLLRQLGRGGMGVVYLAEQVSLQRQVALKLVRPDHLLFPGARERFRREVLAVARLSHPGIVPVYTYAEHDGVPCYAMQRLLGATLQELLRELAGLPPATLSADGLRPALARVLAAKGDAEAPVADGDWCRGSWVRACSRIVRDAALAVHHAHVHGVLHRDLKPSNLVLDTTGGVHVIDFGLATAQGAQRLTRSNAVLGSLPYMAPEQLRGDIAAIDARTDVYALGVTLYELLTLALPHGDGTGTTRERILAGAAEPPRRKNALVDADAEAICLQAMDPDRGRRYATAAEFALDLDRFLADTPVRARPPGPLLRLRRAVARHPGRAAAAVLAFVVFGIGPGLFALQQSAAAERLGAEVTATEHERARAERNLDTALAALDQVVRAARSLPATPRVRPIRQQVLEQARRLHEKLAADGETSPAAREARARAAARTGGLQADFGDLQGARSRLEPAVAELEDLLAHSDHPLRLHRDLVSANQDLAQVYEDLLLPASQLQALAAQRRHLAAVLAESPHDVMARVYDARARIDRCGALGRSCQAELALRELDELDREFRDAVPAEASAEERGEWLRTWPRIPDCRAVLLLDRGDSQAAVANFEESARRFGQIHVDDDDLATLGTLARIQQNLGLIHHQRREWEAALPALDAAIATWGRMRAIAPDMPEYGHRLAVVLGTRADARSNLGDQEAAAADHRQCVDLLTQLAARNPDAMAIRESLGVALGERAAWYQHIGKNAEAGADFAAAVAAMRATRHDRPADERAAANLISALGNAGHFAIAQDEPVRARELLDEALALARPRDTGDGRRVLIELLTFGISVAIRNDDREGAQAAGEEARTRAEALLHEQPDDPARQALVAFVALNHGIGHLQYQEHEQAIAVWTAALPTARTAAAHAGFGRMLLACILLRLCDVHLRDHDVPGAREWFQRAIAETGATPARLKDQPPLAALFEREELRDLVPPAKAAAPGGGGH